MKEKTADIDILEEMIKPIATRTFIFPDGRKEEKEIYNLERKQIEAIETLIAENKELKDSNVELATIIDCLQTDLKEIKEEYSAEQKYEMENTIPKSKAKEEIDGKFKEVKGLYERGVQPQAQYTMKLLRDLEQSLLGKK